MAYNPRLGVGPAAGSGAARVFVLAADALAARALRAALGGEPRLELVDHAQDADVVVWDLGADAKAALALLQMHATRGVSADKPLLALVADEASSAYALQ